MTFLPNNLAIAALASSPDPNDARIREHQILASQGAIHRRAGMTGYTPHGPLGVGTAPLGNLGTVVPEDSAVGCLQAAWDGGIRHYDTAPHYGAGLAEHRL